MSYIGTPASFSLLSPFFFFSLDILPATFLRLFFYLPYQLILLGCSRRKYRPAFLRSSRSIPSRSLYFSPYISPRLPISIYFLSTFSFPLSIYHPISRHFRCVCVILNQCHVNWNSFWCHYSSHQQSTTYAFTHEWHTYVIQPQSGWLAKFGELHVARILTDHIPPVIVNNNLTNHYQAPRY